MRILQILKFYYQNYLYFNRYSFSYLLLLSIITGVLSGISLYFIFAFIQFLTTKKFDNDFVQNMFFYLTQYINISSSAFLLLLIIITFSLKIYFNGLYFIKSEIFRIDVSVYLSKKRIKTYDSNILSDLTVHLTKSDTFNELLLSIILQLSSVIFSIFILFSLSFNVTFLIFIIVTPFIYFTSIFFSRRVIENVNNYNNAMYDYISFLSSYNLHSPDDISQFSSKTQQLKNFQLAISRSRFLSTNFYEILFFLIILILMVIDLENKVVFLGLLIKIITSFQSIIQNNQKIQIRFESFKKFYE